MDKFGVHLKHTELPNSREKERVRQTNTRRNQPANLKDLKNMFEGKSDGGTDSSSAPVSMGTDFKRSYTTQKTVTKTKTTAKTVKDEEDLAVFSQFKFSIDANKNTTLERTDSPKGSRKFPKDDKLAEPQVVKSKVMASSSKTFKASVDSKVHRLNSEEKNSVPVDKKMAASSLIGNLALLQTRPGFGKKSDSSTVQSETSKSNGIFSEKSSLLKDKKTSSKESVNSDKKISKLTSKTSETTIDSGEKKLQVLRASLKRTGSDKKGQFEKGSAYTKKPETSVSPGPGLSRQSSSDSVASEKLSPRTSLRSKNRLKLDQSACSDTGSSGSLSPRNKSFSPECKDEKPEWMEKSKELVNKFQTKLKKPESESTTSVSVSTNKSSTSASSTSKSTSTHKTETVTNTSSTFSKASVQRTDSGKQSTSLAKKETLVTKDASSSKEFLEKFAKDKDSKEQRAEKLVLSRKESSELFQKLKGGYKQSDDASKSAQPKPKIEVPNSNKFVERRNSFEKPKPADTTKCKTLRHLQDEGKIVGVKDRISALNQGKGEVVDERFKKQIQSQKSVESVRSSDQEYHDVAVNPAPANDWPSDSDSSADNMYEYIPATGEAL